MDVDLHGMCVVTGLRGNSRGQNVRGACVLKSHPFSGSIHVGFYSINPCAQWALREWLFSIRNYRTQRVSTSRYKSDINVVVVVVVVVVAVCVCALVPSECLPYLTMSNAMNGGVRAGECWQRHK
jgi:hypothetical protein